MVLLWKICSCSNGRRNCQVSGVAAKKVAKISAGLPKNRDMGITPAGCSLWQRTIRRDCFSFRIFVTPDKIMKHWV